MGAPPGLADPLQGPLQAFAEGRAGPSGGWAVASEGNFDGRQIGGSERTEKLDRGRAQLALECRLLWRRLAGRNARKGGHVQVVSAAKGAISQGETFVGGEAKGPRHGVLVSPELHSVEEQLHQSCLRGVLALVRIAEGTLAKASKNRPEDGEHRAERCAVAGGERGHGVLDLFTLARLHRFSGLVLAA
jgi:hypothetical protein